MGERARVVAIVGGGFSGTMVATHLLRLAPAGSAVHIVERRHALGRGIAYGTRYDSHVLNVRASGMSALPDHPTHFLEWAQARPELFERPVQAGDFLPRRLYGAYVQSLLESAAAARTDEVELRRWNDEAIDLQVDNGRATVALESGGRIEADAVVLATGHFPPGHPNIENRAFLATERYVGDPWSPGHLDAVHRDEVVLLIGSGLTALDLTQSLVERGHRGSVHMLSRSGRLPQPHRTAEPYHDFLAGEAIPSSVRGLTKRVRNEIERASEQGVDWRPVLDALRPRTQQIWRALAASERRRFLKGVRSYWETHRHRMPTQVEQMATDLQQAGRLHLHRGRIVDLAEANNAVRVTYVSRDSGFEETIWVHHVVNCTGPECDYRRMRHPLYASLVASGLARPDELSLGLDTDERGALLNQSGAASRTLFTLGPIRKGTLWETTAVPEIRVQAHEIARLLIEG